MHIVIDCRSIHHHMAGIGRVAYNLAKHIGQRVQGQRVTALIGSRPPPDLSIPGVDLLPLDSAMIDEPFEQLGLPAVLEEIGADIYLNTTFSVPALKTTSFQISIIHDVVFEDHPEWVEEQLRGYLQRWSRFASKYADRIVTVSDHARSRICEVYKLNESKVIRIYNGIEKESFARPSNAACDKMRHSFGLNSDYILYLGSIEPKKGVPELLNAFACLPARTNQPPIHLVLAGGKGGPDFNVDVAIGRTGCADRIRYLGYVDEAAKKALISECALLVYPSHYEGFGLPPLEAMALGVPCVVNKATSIPEIVRDEAIRIDVRDREIFARAIERGLHDQEFRAKAKASGPERAKMFSWERAAEQYVDLFNSLGNAGAS
jgi:glycosyltransferase involved in cell wall biosynthesis